MKISEAWTMSTEDGRIKVTGASAQAHKVTVEVTIPGTCSRHEETPERKVGAEITADEWREMVQAVERKLIRRGDPQR